MSRRIVSAAAAAALSGIACSWPVAVCEEYGERRSIRFAPDEVELLEGGGFRVQTAAREELVPGRRRGEFASCAELCRREPDVDQVLACTEPAHVDERFAGDLYGNSDERLAAGHWRMECAVVTISCEQVRTRRPFGGG